MNKKTNLGIGIIFIIALLLIGTSNAAFGDWFNQAKNVGSGLFGGGNTASDNGGTSSEGDISTQINNQYKKLITLIDELNDIKPPEGQDYEEFYNNKEKKLSEIIKTADRLISLAKENKNNAKYLIVYDESTRIKQEANTIKTYIIEFERDDSLISGKSDGIITDNWLYFDKKYKDKTIKSPQTTTVEKIEEKNIIQKTIDNKVDETLNDVKEGAKKTAWNFVKAHPVGFGIGGLLILMIIIASLKFALGPILVPLKFVVKSAYKILKSKPARKVYVFFLLSIWYIIRNVLVALYMAITKRRQTDADLEWGKNGLTIIEGKVAIFVQTLFTLRSLFKKKDGETQKKEDKNKEKKKETEEIKKTIEEQKPEQQRLDQLYNEWERIGKEMGEVSEEELKNLQEKLDKQRIFIEQVKKLKNVQAETQRTEATPKDELEDIF